MPNIYLSLKMDSEQYMNSKVNILGKRVHSPNLRDVAVLKKPSVAYLTFHTFARKLAGKNYRQMYEKLKMQLNVF